MEGRPYLVVKLLDTDDDCHNLALSQWIISIDDAKEYAVIKFPCIDDADFFVKNNLDAASDWDSVSVKILRFHRTYEAAKQTYLGFCKYPNYETGSDIPMGRGHRGKKKKSLTDSDSESPLTFKRTKLLAAAPVLSQLKKPAAAGSAQSTIQNQTAAAAPVSSQLKKPAAAGSARSTVQNVTAACSTSNAQKPIAPAPTINLKKPTTTKSKVNTSIVVQTRGIKSKQKVLNNVAKSRSIPETSRLEQLEKKKQEILKDREKKSAAQEEKRQALLESIRTGKRAQVNETVRQAVKTASFPERKGPQSLCLNKTFSTVQVKSTVLSGVSEPKASKSDSGLLDKSIENEDSGFHDGSGEATAFNDDYSDSQLLDYEADDLMDHLDDATPNKDVSAGTEIDTGNDTGNETEISAQMSINKAHVSKDNNQKVITNPVGLLQQPKEVNSDNAPHTPKEKQQSATPKSDRRLARIERLLGNLNSKMDIMLGNQGKVNKALIPHERRLQKPYWVKKAKLPIRKHKYLAYLETELSDDEKFSEFTYYLEALGMPADEDKLVSVLLPQLMSNWMGTHYSFDGLGEKYPFKELNLWKAIEAASYMKYETTLDKVITSLRSWLRNAKGRTGGKEPPDDSPSDEESSTEDEENVE